MEAFHQAVGRQRSSVCGSKLDTMSDGLEDNAMGAMDNKKFKIYPQAEPNG